MYSLAEEVSLSTVAATATATGHHMLKIKGYSRLQKLHGNCSAVVSVEFQAAGHTWKIAFYPNGAREEDAGFVSVILQLAGNVAAETAIVAEYELDLVHHQDGGPSKHKVEGTGTFRVGNSWGYPKFISKKALERSAFLKDDCLAVHCKIRVIEESVSKEEVVQAQDLERMGLVCPDDDACKRHAVSTAKLTIEDLEMTFVRFAMFLCG
ncbi:hypothetical protein PR202_gb12205 [Eleusine coracana subsp. coracana]|uniref:MATH domain-containing protein n=1 Tax=Eleusine coracana subsp. coracana TaxID=191504 RepID=A0AAV5EQF0_ELECO|nr:hypothetical protein QOZ80_7BG0586080 [Eleusine coracana subsp. coracana]GJN24465.1 hypothetical protein PR202_gb12205 [Eleusine coracana subsp. coracana]